MALVVDGKSGHLKRERDDVDGGVEQRGLELGFEINEGRVARWHASVRLAGQVDHGAQVNCELAEYGANRVEVEDVGQRSGS